MMSAIAPGFELADDAAASYARARRDGLPEGITSARRDPDEQRALFLARYRPQAEGSGPYGDVRTYGDVRYVRVSALGSVAVPGSEWSRHEKGLSLDLPAGGPREWMHAHGAAYGWIGGLVDGEPWHFEYQADKDTHPTPIAPPTLQEDSHMVIIRMGTKTSGYSYTLVTGARAVPVTQPGAKAFKKAGVKVAVLPNVDYRRLVTTLGGEG